MTQSPLSLAHEHLIHGHYHEAVAAYAQIIDIESTHPEQFWNYGIALLLSGQEEAAQSIWMSVVLEASSELEQEQWAAELVQALEDEAQRCEARGRTKAVWILRRYQCEFAPNDPLYWRDAVIAGLQAKMISLDSEELKELGAIAHQSSSLFTELQIDKTGQLLQLLLSLHPTHPTTQAFVASCIRQVQDTPQATPIIEILRQRAWALRNQQLFQPAGALIQQAVQLAPRDIGALKDAIEILIGDIDARRKGLQLAERLVSLAKTPTERLNALEILLIRTLRVGGQGQTLQEIYPTYKTQFQALAREVEPIAAVDALANPEIVHSVDEQLGELDTLMTAGVPCLYFEDDPQAFRPLRNQIAAAVQAKLEVQHPFDVQRFRAGHHQSTRQNPNRPLRIGYLADTFREHSVGWLSRWLLAHHDRDRFDIHLYSPTARSHDFVQGALMQDYGDRFHVIPDGASAIANRIFDDQIDILVELDDLMRAKMLGAVALKPAPIQVAWLGFDAPGLPAVDYFIADPFVLSATAEQAYQEKIWRLPQTYIAVDGFESYTPTLRRPDLDIPVDAVVYLSSQSGLKRNPHNVKLQLQILKSVPNSYFLIKSLVSAPELLRPFFYELAEEVGVPSDRLRFLPDFPLEFTYRANLHLADIVLDTYPYNGATTTLEALWMGLPIVTRVGEQFAARNSYTMMVNAGIQEGITWSDEEYMEWGIRLGQDEALRRDVVWKLRRSRHSAPLWNARRFATEMENAYEQMWHQRGDRPLA